MRSKAAISVLVMICLALVSGCAGAESTSSSSGNGVLVASTKPSSPKNLIALATDKTITLNWDMAAWEDKYTFDIYRWQPGREPMILDSVPAGVHTYTDPSANEGRYYFYAVVSRNIGASLSDSTAQIGNVSLQPPPPESVYDPLAGYLPPNTYYNDSSKESWIQRRIDEIRETLPYVFVTEKCPRCGGVGIIQLPTSTNGVPDLTYCPECKGTGSVTNVYPKS
jgi:hypothetical protein